MDHSLDQQRDQLIGQLAVDVGFLTLDQLKSVNCAPSKSIGKVLVESGVLSDAEISALEQLLALKLARYGDNPEAALASLHATVSLYNADTDATRDFSAGVLTAAASTPEFAGYELLEQIGKGGMGVVYKARQAKPNRIVALKMIRAGGLADEHEIERFKAEAEAAAKLDYPGIVPIYEVGEANGEHFFSMGFVDGNTLADLLRDGPLKPSHSAELLKQISDAVAYAHSKQIIHRDLKPGNILLDHEGHPRITDFGLAKQLSADTEMTATGQVLGTPSYMPPEQASGGDTGTAADIYALGATLYTMTTGKPPHQAANPTETLLAVLNKDPLAPRLINDRIPKDLETICLRCLNKEPWKRYASCEELSEDLSRWLRNEPIAARRVGRLEKSWLWCKRRPVVAALIVTVVLMTVVGSAVFIERQTAKHAEGLVNSLSRADVAQLPTLIDEISAYRRWAEPILEEYLVAASDGTAKNLHLRLALVGNDPSHVSDLKEAMLEMPAIDVAYIAVIRAELKRYQAQVVDELWATLHNTSLDNTIRFNAGLALIGFQPGSESWTQDDYKFLVDQLVAANPIHHPALFKLMHDIRRPLVEPLVAAFLDPQRSESKQIAAANALAAFAREDTVRMISLVAEATASQFAVLFPLLESSLSDAALKRLQEFIEMKPGSKLLQAERVKSGKKRAGAAITLLRKGEIESIFDVFRVNQDPESLTQFVHGCKDRGVSATQLLACLQKAETNRQGKVGEERRMEDRVLFGLLLALGEFDATDVPLSRRAEVVDQIADWYGNDASSAIHSASGWLLRKWGYTKEAEVVDQTVVAPSQAREWFVQKIEGESTGFLGFRKRTRPFFFTFIVFPPGKFRIGSPVDEDGRQEDETLKSVSISRSFAVLDREITRAEYEFFTGKKLPNDNVSPPPGEHPMIGPAWYEAVDFCRALTAKSGLDESEQCYADPQQDSSVRESAALFRAYPRDWKLHSDRSGFRLPTEAEWEVACRAGTSSMYGFGNDRSLLPEYGWFRETARMKSHISRHLRPNLRGLFDMHGNAYEWCHDWGTSRQVFRILRGGGFAESEKAHYKGRSSARGGDQPMNRVRMCGFRVVRLVSFGHSP